MPLTTAILPWPTLVRAMVSVVSHSVPENVQAPFGIFPGTPYELNDRPRQTVKWGLFHWHTVTEGPSFPYAAIGRTVRGIPR